MGLKGVGRNPHPKTPRRIFPGASLLWGGAPRGSRGVVFRVGFYPWRQSPCAPAHSYWPGTACGPGALSCCIRGPLSRFSKFSTFGLMVNSLFTFLPVVFEWLGAAVAFFIVAHVIARAVRNAVAEVGQLLRETAGYLGEARAELGRTLVQFRGETADKPKKDRNRRRKGRRSRGGVRGRPGSSKRSRRKQQRRRRRRARASGRR